MCNNWCYALCRALIISTPQQNSPRHSGEASVSQEEEEEKEEEDEKEEDEE